MAAHSRSSAHSRGYTWAWRKARQSYLLTHPLCVVCQQAGRVTPATVVDHITPHRGDQRLFWSRENWQALCAPCHDRHKARAERSGHGYVQGCDADGLPLDPSHPWTGDRQGVGRISRANAPETVRRAETS